MIGFSFRVNGEAKPAGSKRFVGVTKAGKGILTDANPHAKDWKARVAYTAAEKWKHAGHTGPLEGPVKLTIRFFVNRPVAHWNSKGKVKPAAPQRPVRRPDLLKLARAIEDSLSGILYVDDSQIVEETLEKVWACPHSPEGVIVTIEQPVFSWACGGCGIADRESRGFM